MGITQSFVKPQAKNSNQKVQDEANIQKEIPKADKGKKPIDTEKKKNLDSTRKNSAEEDSKSSGSIGDFNPENKSCVQQDDGNYEGIDSPIDESSTKSPVLSKDGSSTSTSTESKPAKRRSNRDKQQPKFKLPESRSRAVAAGELKEVAIIDVIETIRENNSPQLRSMIVALKELLKSVEKRREFIDFNGVELLFQRLEANSNPPTPDFQLQYNILFCIWRIFISGDEKMHFMTENTIHLLGTILKTTSCKKVVRMIAAIMASVFEDSSSMRIVVWVQKYAFSEFLKRHLLNHVDPEMEADIDFIQTALDNSEKTMLSFDYYKETVEKGELSWANPAHRSEEFWTTNIGNFAEQGFLIVKMLRKLLHHENSEVACVAVHDLGEFAKHHDRGRKILSETYAMEEIMKLLTSDNDLLRYQALRAMQKALMRNSDILGFAATEC